jgi:hypothetical protein
MFPDWKQNVILTLPILAFKSNYAHCAHECFPTNQKIILTLPILPFKTISAHCAHQCFPTVTRKSFFNIPYFAF